MIIQRATLLKSDDSQYVLTLAFPLCGSILNDYRKYNNLVQVVLSAFVAASQAAPQLVYPYGLGYSHAITHAVPTTVKKVNIERDKSN